MSFSPMTPIMEVEEEEMEDQLPDAPEVTNVNVMDTATNTTPPPLYPVDEEGVAEDKQVQTMETPEKQFQHVSTDMADMTPDPDEERYRPCQTNVAVQAFGTKTTPMQTGVDKGQQMEKVCSGLYYPSEASDYFIVAKPYQTYDQWQRKRNHAATIIQKYWRRELGLRERLRREDLLVKRVQWAEKLRMGRQKQRQKIIDKEIERQQCPTRLVDLELLYRAINVWRTELEAWVNKNRWGGEKKAALSSLTDIEADLLLELERTKNRINVQQRENRTLAYFDKMGAPKRWLSEKSANFITIDDDGKKYARKLRGIYAELQSPVERSPEGTKTRVDLLSRLEALTKDISTSMSAMLMELVSRELTFLKSTKTSIHLLAGVRRRISSAFFFLCQDSNFNPEAKRVDKIPHDLMKLRKDIVQCKGCRRMIHRDEFTIIKGTTVSDRCLTCMNLYRTAILRLDLNLYRHMLKELRQEEMEAGVVNSVTFLMDAFDLKFLVDEIWHGQSALSGVDNRYVLRLCRWNKDKPWAPWNCVLLSDEEACAHLHIERLEDAYKDTFFHKVFVKQATAKSYFQGIAKLMVELDERIKEHCKTLDTKAKHVVEMKEKMKKRIKAAMLG